MGFTVTTNDAVAEIVMEHPPVNALTVAGWFELADLVTRAGRDPHIGAVVLRAEGKGFNAGVDIKEMQATEGFDALIGANRGCYAAFKAVYECEVPVIAAVHDFCLGGGIGLVGNADVIVAAEGTTFGLPEVNQGALGAATHLARLVPQHKMREMVYTAEPITAETQGTIWSNSVSSTRSFAGRYVRPIDSNVRTLPPVASSRRTNGSLSE